jgi:hypothetical protein
MTPDEIATLREAQQRAEDYRQEHGIHASPPPTRYLTADVLLESGRLKAKADQLAQ